MSATYRGPLLPAEHALVANLIRRHLVDLHAAGETAAAEYRTFTRAAAKLDAMYRLGIYPTDTP